jgi:hypothetical protein
MRRLIFRIVMITIIVVTCGLSFLCIMKPQIGRYGYGKMIWTVYWLFSPEIRSDKYLYFWGDYGDIYLAISNVSSSTLEIPPIPVDVLDLTECNINNLTTIQNKKLRGISIVDSNIDNIPLFSHKTIKSIYFRNSNIATLNSFSDQPLERVSLSNLGELSSLSGLSPSIRHLFVRNCKRINSVEGLASLSVIRWLILEGTSVRNISSLSKAENLITLNLNNTLVDDLTPLEKLKNLQTLEIIGTPASKKPLPDWLNKTILRD